MNRQKAKPVGELLQSYIDAMGLRSAYNAYLLQSEWPLVVGEVVARHTSHLEVRQRKLYVSVSSSALRSELLMRRAGLVRTLNERVGAAVINDIVLR